MKKTFFIVNPNSANGTTGKIWPQIKAAAEARIDAFETLFTEHIGHAADLTRQALAEGAELIVSVGGDGTNNEVANGLMKPDGTPVNPDVELAIICMGTGGDFRKTLAIPKDYREAVTALAQGRSKLIDLGRMEMKNHEGEMVTRYFINIASFGIGGDVDDRVNKTSKALGGKASFMWGSLKAMMAYRNKKVHVLLDDENDLGERQVFNVAVANGQFHGGGMHIAPHADLSDGLFDVIVLGDFKKLETMMQMPKIYNAGHIGHPKVETYRAKKVVATSNEQVLLDVDGEQPGMLPTTFTICPGVVKLRY